MYFAYIKEAYSPFKDKEIELKILFVNYVIIREMSLFYSITRSEMNAP